MYGMPEILHKEFRTYQTPENPHRREALFVPPVRQTLHAEKRPQCPYEAPRREAQVTENVLVRRQSHPYQNIPMAKNRFLVRSVGQDQEIRTYSSLENQKCWLTKPTKIQTRGVLGWMNR